MSQGLTIFTYILGFAGTLICAGLMVKIARSNPRYKKPIIHLAILAGMELLLALSLSADWVKEAPRLLAFAEIIGRFAPVVGNFNQVALYPEGTRVFLAITICLLPLKIFLFCVCAYVIEGSRDEQLSVRNFLLIIFGTIIILYAALTFNNSPGSGFRGLGGFWKEGIKLGGILLWFSWSIFQLGMVSFLLSAALLAIWQKCISLFHNLRT
jgi:uncharacterized membrane protein